MDSNSSNEFYTETQTFFEQADTSAYPASSFSSILIKLLIGFLLYSLTIWTIIGNIIVCVIVLTNRQLKQGGMSNFLIGNLALSDLLLGLTVLPFSATLSTFKTWLFGRSLFGSLRPTFVTRGFINRQNSVRSVAQHRCPVLNRVDMGTAGDLSGPLHRHQSSDPLPEAKEQHQNSHHLLHGLVAHQHNH